ncbi:MAG: effector, partial [Candidatus Phytoplasma australasiaticum]|nr:effector [Candidatus Phytoplasma australasiaticum]
MNKKNFWPKYFIVIMVGIAIIIMINKNRYSTSKPQLYLFTLKSAKETLDSEASEIEKPLSPKPKRSLENSQPKMKTTVARLEPIKTYLFTESANSAYLPSDLLEREKEEIAKIKKSWQSSLDLLKDDKITINEKQKECDQYQSQLN